MKKQKFLIKCVAYLFIYLCIYGIPKAAEAQTISVGDTIEVGGIFYKVTKYSSGDNQVSFISKAGGYSGDLVVPATVDYEENTFTVTAIDQVGGSLNNVTSITWPNTITELKSYAFKEATKDTLDLPNSLKTINTYAFTDSHIKYFNMPSGGTYLKTIDGVMFSADGDTLYAYPSQKVDISYDIPEGTKVIRARAFYAYSLPKLEQLHLPASLTKIEGELFTSYALKSFSVDESNTVFSTLDGVLMDKSKTAILKYPINRDGDTYVVPEMVTSIGKTGFASDNALRGQNLKTLVIPENVSTMKFRCLFYLPTATTIIFLNATPPSIDQMIRSDANKIFVPCENVEDYKTATNWTKYTNINGIDIKKVKETICDDEKTDTTTYAFTYDEDASACKDILTITNTIVNNLIETTYDTVEVMDSELPYTFGSLSLTESGDYEQVFEAENGCDSTVILHFNVLSGIADIQNTVSIDINPNPTIDDIILNTKGLQSEAIINILDLSGRVIMTDKLSKGQSDIKLNTANLPSGQYLIKILCDETTISEKFIKQ